MKIDKPEISGLLILFIGVGLLAFTFLNAYWFLVEDITIVASQDLVAAFGQALAPLVATCIHVMYLGIMGWIGSLLTLRGIPLLTHPKVPVTTPQPTPTQAQVITTPTTEAKPAKKEEKAKEKPKQEKVEKPQPPEKPKEEPKKEKEPEKKPEPEKPEITIEVRPPEEVAVETPKPTPEAPQKQSSPQESSEE